MSISFSGLASGLDTDSWIKALVAVKQQQVTNLETKQTDLSKRSSNLTTLKSTYSSFLSSINKLTDSRFSTTSDVFASKTATSSNDAVSVSVSSSAVVQSLAVKVQQLATSTVATSANGVGSLIDENTQLSNLANGSIKEGKFSFFVDDEQFTINVSKGDTLGNVATKMEDATRGIDTTSEDYNTYTDEELDHMREGTTSLIDVSINDGKFSVDSGSASVVMGSAQDSSNIYSVLSLKKDATGGTNSYTSSEQIRNIDLSAKLLGADSPLPGMTAGTFNIGNATFEINQNTTLQSLMNKINSTNDAGVTVGIDQSTGKMSFTSKTTGEFNISMSNGTSDFLEKLGLTDGNKLGSGTQKLGQNAKLTINGDEYESFSNTVTSDTTKIAGVTLTLNDETETDKTARINVTQDVDSSISAIKSFVSAYNKVYSETDEVMDADSTLKHETGLSSLKSGLRSSLSGFSLASGDYKTLFDIGISTGSYTTDMDSDTNTLVVDETKLKKALQDNPDLVKEILVGDLENGTSGVLGQMKETVQSSLDAKDGYFAIKNKSLNDQITSLNSKIEKKQTLVDSYQARLEKQFDAMEKLIASMQSQYSSVLSK